MSTRRLFLLTLVLAAVLGSCASSASAWKYSSLVTGSPGKVANMLPVDIADVFYGRDAFGGTMSQFTLATGAGPVLSRSPATRGEQTLGVRYQVQVWVDDRWVATTQQTSLAVIPAGRSSAQLPGLTVTPTLARGYFRVVVMLVWSGEGRALGSVVVVPSRASDHRCVTRLRRCASTSKYFRTGLPHGPDAAW